MGKESGGLPDIIFVRIMRPKCSDFEGIFNGAGGSDFDDCLGHAGCVDFDDYLARRFDKKFLVTRRENLSGFWGR